MNLFKLLLEQLSEAEEAAKKADDFVAIILEAAKKRGGLNGSLIEKITNPVVKEKVEKLIEKLTNTAYKNLSTKEQELFDFILEKLTPENTFGKQETNPFLRDFLDKRSPLGSKHAEQIPSFREGSKEQARLKALRDGLPSRSVPTIDDIDDMKNMDPTEWSPENIDDLADDYIKNNPNIPDDLKEITRKTYKAYLEYLKSGETGVTSTGQVGGTIRELGVFKASDGLEYDVSKLLNNFDPVKIEPDPRPTPPPPLDDVATAAEREAATAAVDRWYDAADDATRAAAGDDAFAPYELEPDPRPKPPPPLDPEDAADAARAARAARETAVRETAAQEYRTIADDVLDQVPLDADLNPLFPDDPLNPSFGSRVEKWAKKAVDARKVTGQIAKQQIVNPGKVVGALGYGGDLAVSTGMDVYDASTNPQWAYGKDSEGNELSYGSVFSDIPGNVATATGAGLVIGGGVGLLGGPLSPVTAPAAALSGAVIGFVGSLATALKDIVQAPVRIGYGKEGLIKAKKSELETFYELQKNNPSENYSDRINQLKSEIEREENQYGFERGLATGMDSVADVLTWGGSWDPKTVIRKETKSGEQLKAEAEAAFAERYPQGIEGGLVPGKSANQVEKEAADMILSRLNKGPNDIGPNNQGASSPEELAKEFGWETEEQRKAREEREVKEIEFMASDPEKYGNMKRYELDAAVSTAVTDDRWRRIAAEERASREAREKQDAEHRTRIQAVEDEIAKKEADRKQMDDLTRQQQSDARAINAGLSKEKRDEAMRALEASRALSVAGEESKKRRKEEEIAKEKAASASAREKRKKEFAAKMAEMDKRIAGNDAMMGSYDDRGLPIAPRRSRYGHLVSDGEGWGT